MVDYNGLMDYSLNLLMIHGPSIVFAILTLIIGWWLIGSFTKALQKGFEKSKMKKALRQFILSFTGIGLKILLLVTVASMLGFATTSLVAVLAAAGFAIGLALQGSLSNFAGGVLILVFEPFKIGDFIEAQGQSGTVHKIEIFNTILKTPDNKTIIVPNGALSNGTITNFSTESRRRVDMTFGISYESDIKKAKSLLEKLLSADKRVLSDPKPMIVVSSLGDSSVNISVRAWAETKDYWGIFFEMQEKVKLEFDKNKISIPYPQMDVHMKK